MAARLIMKLDVTEVHSLAGGVRRYVMRHPRRPELPLPEAGSHVDLRLPDGRVRQYSLCGDPADSSRYVIAVKREEAGRGGSAWLHANLQPGSVAHVSSPRNHFALAADAPHHLLIGGGIGITPLVAMAWQLQRSGARYELHVLARDAAQAPPHAQDLVQDQADRAQRDGAVGDVEAGEVAAAEQRLQQGEAELQEVDHVAVQQAVDHVAQRAAHDHASPRSRTASASGGCGSSRR
jgi:ferredoxin-NADP reductase